MKKKLYILFTFFLLLCMLIGFFIYQKQFHPQGKTHTILLTRNGFTPSTLQIQQYDTVIFKTELQEDFWPASDLHPTHGIYPEFDPLEPVNHSKSWSFTFDKNGKWAFHNHLDPWARGTIYVLEK